MPRTRAFGFVGAGRMAEGLARGFVARAGVRADDIIASDVDSSRLRLFADELGTATTTSNAEVVRSADTIILAVKPQILSAVLDEMGAQVSPDQVLVSIAAGVPTVQIRSHLDVNVPVVRVMPNICCVAGEGAFAYCVDGPVSEDQEKGLTEVLGSMGTVVRVEEHVMDAVTGLSGSGPAFVFMLIEGLADGGVAAGLDRRTAEALAAQTVLGAGRMALDTPSSPAQLKDMVCSPGGTTIAGVRLLRERGFQGAAMEAVIQAARRSRELAS
ncbi:MAG: pyrroline-5-carboxylate reductase [Armatimonadota bacterium]